MMKQLVVIFILLLTIKAQSQHPLSGKLLLSLEGGFTAAQTDYRHSNVGSGIRQMIEYYFYTDNVHLFGLRLFAGGQNISGLDNSKELNKFRTGMYTAGLSGIYSISYRSVIFPYLSMSISQLWFDTKMENSRIFPSGNYNIDNATSFSFEGELGFKIPISETVLFNISGSYQYLPNDLIDNTNLGLNNDFFLKFMGGISISFFGTRDSDKDNIADNEDACKDLKEDFDGFEDNDGCPEFDNDKDGILDRYDKCINLTEDLDGFEDNDGCPDEDNDADGIADNDDKCQNAVEDFDGFEDNDGCPDLDNDKDGIQDVSDKCINTPEDLDGFEDNDGCPDLDNDRDGLADKNDKCPDSPENFNGYLDTDGCPDKIPEKEKTTDLALNNKNNSAPVIPEKRNTEKKRTEESFIVHGEITFERDQAIIKKSAYHELDKIVQLIKENPKSKWSIEGHMDAGSSAKATSKKRAEAIYKYFTSKGLSPGQFSVVGFGDKFPVESNDKVYGRMKNRRVVIKRIE